MQVLLAAYDKYQQRAVYSPLKPLNLAWVLVLDVCRRLRLRVSTSYQRLGIAFTTDNTGIYASLQQIRFRTCSDNHQKRGDVDLDRPEGVKRHAQHSTRIKPNTKRPTSAEANGMNKHVAEPKADSGGRNQIG